MNHSLDDTTALACLGEQAAEAIRSLNHLTRGPDAFTDPTQACRLLADLSVTTARLPQLLNQIATWLHSQQHTGQLRVDATAPTDDPAETINSIAGCLTQAGHCAHHLSDMLDTAHQHAAHLAAAP